MTAPFVRPELTDLNRGFWEAAGQGRLVVQRCGGCGELRHPPAPVCPRCLSPEWSWDEVSGRGELFSWVVFHHGYHERWRDRVPYNVVLVQLDEGPRMFGNVVPLDRTAGLAAGLRVRVVFEDEDGFVVPRFAVDPELPAGAAGTEGARA